MRRYPGVAATHCLNAHEKVVRPEGAAGLPRQIPNDLNARWRLKAAAIPVFISPLEATRQLDRRRSQRVTANLRARLSLRGRLFGAKHKAFIIDYSMLGLRVRAETGLTLGQLVRITSETNPGHPVVCQVVWVAKAGSPQEGEAGLAMLDIVS
jgi:hypothetical protein